MSHTARFIFEQAGQEQQVVLEFDDGVAQGTVAFECRNIIWALMRVHTSSSVELIRVEVGDSATGVVEPVNENGQANVNACPPTISYLITKVVAGGRNGRIFWPGITEANVGNDGRLTASHQAAMQTTVDTVIGNLGTAGLTMVVTETGGTENPVTALTCREVIGHQRRRLYN